MIKKIEGFKNKYYVDGQYSNLNHIYRDNYANKVNCIICNKNTAESVRFGKKITINNSLSDNEFFINGKF